MIILGVILLSFIIRIISLGQSLWWDEAINVTFAKSLPFWDFIRYYSVADFHPPGYFAILWMWGHIFGFSEVSVRMPSVIFGVLTVYLTYLIGRTLVNKRVGLLSALFLALGPLHLYYSQESRMYAFAAFAVTLSMYFFIRLFQGSKSALFGYAFSITLVLYSDYVAYFAFLPQLLFVFLYKRSQLRRVLAAFILGFIPFLGAVVIFIEQFQVGKIEASSLQGWGKVVGGVNLKDLLLFPIKTLIGRVSFESNFIYGFVVSSAALPFLVAFTKMVKFWKSIPAVILFWLFIPPVVAFLFSFYTPVFAYFRLLFVLPAVYLLLAIGANYFTFRKLLIITGFFIVAESLMSGIYLFNTSFHRENWKEAVQFVEANMKIDDTVLFEYDRVPAAYIYYSLGTGSAIPGLRAAPVRDESYIQDFEGLVANKNRIYLFEYLVDITDPQRLLEKKVIQRGFVRAAVFNFRGVGFVYLYSK